MVDGRREPIPALAGIGAFFRFFDFRWVTTQKEEFRLNTT
jgi:hypothetical protein